MLTATFEDIEEIVEIYIQVIAVGQKAADIASVATEDREKWFKGHTPDKDQSLVAVDCNMIVGYLTISPYRTSLYSRSKLM